MPVARLQFISLVGKIKFNAFENSSKVRLGYTVNPQPFER